MERTLHTYKGATLDEAYQAMRRDLGPAATVVRTAQVREGGLWGFFARTVIEVTATVPAATAPSRPLSPAERKYAAQSSLGDDQTVNETVAYFQRLVSDAQKRIGASPSEPPRPAAAAPVASSRETLAPVLPFKRPQDTATSRDDLRREVQEMRQMLQVLMAETPGAGIASEFVPYYRDLLERGVSRNLAAALMADVSRDSDTSILRDPRVFAERLKVEIRKRIPVTGGIGLSAGACRVVACIGPTGVGKTTNLAKLAAHYAVRERARVALVTADTYRIGATEQLKIYANIIGLPMTVAEDPKAMASAIRACRDCDLVLIDTAGGSQFNMRQISELKETLGAAQPDEVMLVLGANTQLEELRNIVTNFKCLDPKSLFFTKLDETRRFGVMFSLIAEAGLPLGYLSTGQNVPDDIALARPAALANLIVEGRDKRGRSSTKPA